MFILHLSQLQWQFANVQPNTVLSDNPLSDDEQLGGQCIIEGSMVIRWQLLKERTPHLHVPFQLPASREGIRSDTPLIASSFSHCQDIAGPLPIVTPVTSSYVDTTTNLPVAAMQSQFGFIFTQRPETFIYIYIGSFMYTYAGYFFTHIITCLCFSFCLPTSSFFSYS